jgi:NAD(P)-dependent dehydrogenase (short-subunit alcohol dehydrogenase family)
MRLNGKVALVTGAGGGLGTAIAKRFAVEGASLMCADRDGARAEATASAIAKAGGSARAFRADVGDPVECEAQVGETVRQFGRIDILVNNAGTTKRGDFLELTDADWEDGYALKFFAHVRLARAAWPLLVDAKGALVTIGGTSGRMPIAQFTIGSSVNSAAAAFSKALADRGKTDGVQVNTIHPSHVETERLWRRIKLDMDRTGQDEAAVRREHLDHLGIMRFGTPEDIGGLIAFMVSPRGRWLHGATIDMDGGEVKGM